MPLCRVVREGALIRRLVGACCGQPDDHAKNAPTDDLLACAKSKAMRTAEPCGRIPEGLPRRMDALMTPWASDAAQQRLHAAAERMRQ